MLSAWRDPKWGKTIGYIYTQMQSKIITNTTVETSQAIDGIGSLIIPGGSVRKGDHLEIRTRGNLSTTSAASPTFRVKLGNTVLVASTGTLPNNLSSVYVEAFIDITIKADGVAGSVSVHGRSLINIAQGIAAVYMRALYAPNDVAVDLSVDNKLDLTYQWDTANVANILEIDQFTVRYG